MNKATQSIFLNVSKEVSVRNYDKAHDLLKDTVDNDIFIQRARYLLHCDKKSPYYNEVKAKGNLDHLDNLSDGWGRAEKGRCLLFGELYEQNTIKAEDIFTPLLKKEAKAAYFTAYLNERKLHKDDSGASFGDEDHALSLYTELSKTKNSYRDHAKIACCRLQLNKENTSVQERSLIFTILREQIELGKKGLVFIEATKLMSKFLLFELSSIVDITYDKSNAPTPVLERITFDDDFRASHSSILALESRLVSDNL